MADSVSRLAYDESVRAISAQSGVLDNLRARAGTLIAVASLVTSFLGGQALAKPALADGVVNRADIGWWAVVAMVLFVSVAAMAIAILWPYTWKFDMDSSTILDWPATEYDDALRDLARFHGQNHSANALLLERLFWCLRLGCLFLVLETLSWLIDLRG